MQAEGTLSGPPSKSDLTALERGTISRGSVGMPHGWYFGKPPKISNKELTLTWASRAQIALFLLTEKGPIAFRLPKASTRMQMINRPERRAIKVATPEGVETFTPKTYQVVKTLDILTGRPLPDAEANVEKAAQAYFGYKPGSRHSRALIHFMLTTPQPGEGFSITPTVLITRLTFTDPPQRQEPRLGPWLPPVL
jgi:hypothetical protein